MSTAEIQNTLFQDDCPPFPVRRWSLAEYHALVDLGMFDDERIELLEGWIVPKITRNPRHEAGLTYVEEQLLSQHTESIDS